ncbi:MAG: crossover junction endodeoxyribonuclease RuvC [Candidatus Heimdallarchaeota archaeon]|nr:crossover junction endodeoxyribonuclease RuvC [Candidatus Heimdallarchaeota archaeon]
MNLKLNSMRVLGIDPGLCCCGYGILDVLSGKLRLIEAGVIKTSAEEKLTVRVHKIYRALKQIVEQHQPDVIALEELFSHYNHPKTAILMAHARGMVFLVAAEHKLDVFGYAPKRVKQAVVGTGSAQKAQVQHVIKEMLNLKKIPTPHDVADALAIAIAHINCEGKTRLR